MGNWSLKALAFVACVVGLSGGAAHAHHAHRHQPRPRYAHSEVAVLGKHHAGTFATGPLAGRKMNDLYGVFVGNLGIMPTVLTTDYSNNLRDLWDEKLKRAHYNPEMKRLADKVIREYNAGDIQGISLAQYVNAANTQARLLCSKLDWAKLGHQYFNRFLIGENTRKAKLLRELACNIGGKELVAYSLTELMPGEYDGTFNRQVYDFLLRTAGRKFIESVPAAYDHWISYGPYQFTSLALYDNGHTRVGASVPNQALPPGLQIPGNVVSLHGDNHFRAAYLFAVDNEAHLLRKLNAHELSVLENGWSNHRSDLVVYIAIAHHAPSPAITCARRWLDNKAKNPLYTSCGGILMHYGIKSRNNYAAL